MKKRFDQNLEPFCLKPPGCGARQCRPTARPCDRPGRGCAAPGGISLIPIDTRADSGQKPLSTRPVASASLERAFLSKPSAGFPSPRGNVAGGPRRVSALGAGALCGSPRCALWLPGGKECTPLLRGCEEHGGQSWSAGGEPRGAPPARCVHCLPRGCRDGHPPLCFHCSLRAAKHKQGRGISKSPKSSFYSAFSRQWDCTVCVP